MASFFQLIVMVGLGSLLLSVFLFSLIIVIVYIMASMDIFGNSKLST